MAGAMAKKWDGIAVRTWLDSRIAAARSDQVAAERGGRDRQDDCDKAAAEEMVCSLLRNDKSTSRAELFLVDLRSLLDREDYVWRGVYNDMRFDRHVRSFVKKLIKMARTNVGFENTTRYQ